MSKRTKIIAIVVFVVIVAVALYFYLSPKKTDLPTETNAPVNNQTNTNPVTTNTVVANDDFPLVKGSKGERVKSVQRALNIIKPELKLDVDGKLGNDVYTGVITYVGTKYYPITAANFMTIIQKSQVK